MSVWFCLGKFWNLAEVTRQLGKMVEHQNQSHPNWGLRADGRPCTVIVGLSESLLRIDPLSKTQLNLYFTEREISPSHDSSDSGHGNSSINGSGGDNSSNKSVSSASVSASATANNTDTESRNSSEATAVSAGNSNEQERRRRRRAAIFDVPYGKKPKHREWDQSNESQEASKKHFSDLCTPSNHLAIQLVLLKCPFKSTGCIFMWGEWVTQPPTHPVSRSKENDLHATLPTLKSSFLKIWERQHERCCISLWLEKKITV